MQEYLDFSHGQKDKQYNNQKKQDKQYNNQKKKDKQYNNQTKKDKQYNNQTKKDKQYNNIVLFVLLSCFFWLLYCLSFCPFSFGYCIVCPFSFGYCIGCPFVLFRLVIV
jgi:uncharacterized ion transporter superfamily protein YfcC